MPKPKVQQITAFFHRATEPAADFNVSSPKRFHADNHAEEEIRQHVDIVDMEKDNGSSTSASSDARGQQSFTENEASKTHSSWDDGFKSAAGSAAGTGEEAKHIHGESESSAQGSEAYPLPALLKWDMGFL